MDNKTPTTLDSLPQDVIVRICKKLNMRGIQNTLETFPKVQESLANSEIGFLVHTTQGGKTRCSLLDNVKSLDSPALIDKTMHDIVDNESTSEVIRYPALTKMMLLRGGLSQETLHQITQQCENLVFFKIHLETMDKVDFTSHTLNFPNLKELMIYAPNLGFPPVNQALNNVPMIIENSIHVLKSTKCLSLTRLSLDLPFAASKEEEIIEAVISVVARNKASLKNFLLNLRGDWEAPASEFRKTDEVDYHQDLTGLSLTNFYIRSQNKLKKTLKAFQGILAQQNKLEQIYFDTLEFPQFQMPLILSNSSTLAAIEMDISITSVGGYIDCGVFSGCKGLKILSLISNPTVHIKNNEISGATLTREFTQTKSLPTALQSLRILHLNIHQDDIKPIVTNLTNLNLLELQDIGEKDGFGVTPENINFLRNQNTIKRISIYSGFNVASISEVEKDDFWARIKSTIDDSLCVTLYRRQDVYCLGRNSRDKNLFLGEFIDLNLGADEYKLHYPYGPFQLDINQIDQMEIDEELSESDEEDEEDADNAEPVIDEYEEEEGEFEDEDDDQWDF